MKKESLNEKKIKIRHIFHVLGKSVREYKKSSLLSVFFIGFEALFECVIPLILSFMINDLKDIQEEALSGMTDALKNELFTKCGMYIGILVGLMVFAFIFAILGAKASAKAAIGFAANLRKDIFYKTQSFSFENIDKFSKASLVTRQTTDINNIMMSYMMLIRIGILSPVNFLFSFIASIAIGASVSWIYAITIPVLIIGMGCVLFFAMRIFNVAFPKFDALNKNIEENVRGIRTVKTYTREEYEKEKFAKSSGDIKHLMVKGEIAANLMNPISYLVFELSMILFTAFGAYAMIDGTLKVGQYSALMSYSISALMSLMMLSMVFALFAMSFASGKRICEVLEAKVTIDEPEHALTEIKNGDIEFDHVWFKYDKEGEGYVLKDINLHIPSGATIGIIGGTGSAKSTLVNLIPRFYDVTKGSLKVGGVDVKAYDKVALRNSISMVLQKNVLFSGTLRDNMLWANDKATDEEIQKALDVSQASEFVNSLPNHFDYMVEQGGTNFSGGQKQRLCIARALLKPSKVLVFDDSTSAVDTKTDAKIRDGLKQTHPDVTKIIIAQRVSSVLGADQIIVMDKGQISAIGSAKFLYENSPIFKEVCDLQKVKEEQL